MSRRISPEFSVLLYRLETRRLSPLSPQHYFLIELVDLDFPPEPLANHLGQRARSRRLAVDDVGHARRLFECAEPAQNFTLIRVCRETSEHFDLGAHRNHFAQQLDFLGALLQKSTARPFGLITH